MSSKLRGAKEAKIARSSTSSTFHSIMWNPIWLSRDGKIMQLVQKPGSAAFCMHDDMLAYWVCGSMNRIYVKAVSLHILTDALGAVI